MRFALVGILLATGAPLWWAADGPAAPEPEAAEPRADAIPELAARLEAFAKYKQEYEAANRLTNVSWTRVDFRVGDALTAIGEASIPAPIELVGSEYDDARWTARTSLEELAPKSIPALAAATRDPNALRRAEAATALADAVMAIAEALDDPKSPNRTDPARAPARIGADAAPAVAVLAGQLGEREKYTAESIVNAPANIGETAIGALARRPGGQRARGAGPQIDTGCGTNAAPLWM